MCGRYVLKASAVALQRELHLDAVAPLHPRFNLAPLQAAPIVTDAHPRALTMARWGLLPAWAKDARLASRMINARSETLTQKPAFKHLLPGHRCLVPCDGFYEWRHEGAARLPTFVHRRDGGLLTMAGLWSPWRGPDGLEVVTFTVITTPANAEVQPVHDRMPAFLDEEGRQRWLSGPTRDLEALTALLRPWHGAPLELTAVSTHVNSALVDDAACLEPAKTEQLRLL